MEYELIEAFESVFGSGHPFGNTSTGISGVSDGTEGVQWNCWKDSRQGVAYLGVNLEGMRYDDWPIARLIERELEESLLGPTLERLKSTQNLDLVWMRDAWGPGGSRIPITEKYIGSTPLVLEGLTTESWRSLIKEAWLCLSQTKNGRGRARQTVTAGETAKERFVTPHLQFRRRFPLGSGRWDALFAEGHAQLTPLFDFVRARSDTQIASALTLGR